MQSLEGALDYGLKDFLVQKDRKNGTRFYQVDKTGFDRHKHTHKLSSKKKNIHFYKGLQGKKSLKPSLCLRCWRVTVQMLLVS